MKSIRMLSVYICISLLIACTNQDVYELIRQNRLQECQKLSPYSAYEECVKQYSETYEVYEEKRDSLEKNNT